MENEKIRKRLLRILDMVPALKEILLSGSSLEVKRKKTSEHLSNMLIATFDDDPAIPPLEWVLTRDAITAFKAMLSSRSEKLAGYSLLRYLDDLLHEKTLEDDEKPSSGFLAEMEHLFRGITGKTGVYAEKVPAFVKYEGTRAAKLRSADLSRMGRTTQEFLNRYSCGLDDEVIRARSKNKARILKYFGAT